MYFHNSSYLHNYNTDKNFLNIFLKSYKNYFKKRNASVTSLKERKINQYKFVQNRSYSMNQFDI